MRFAFRIGNHFGFSDGADEDLQGYDANFGALLDELYPFRVTRLACSPASDVAGAAMIYLTGLTMTVRSHGLRRVLLQQGKRRLSPV